MSSSISFYAAKVASIELKLINLIEKIYNSGQKMVLRVKTADEMKLFDDLLWTYSQKTFLAHGSIGTSFPLKQPIYITNLLENVNDSPILLLLNDADDTDQDKFSQLIYFFDGKDQRLNKLMQDKFNLAKNKKHNTIYWQQDDKGSWKDITAEA